MSLYAVPLLGEQTKNVNGAELCDNGSLNSATACGPGQCAPACMIAPYCSDVLVGQPSGEPCDGGSDCKDCHYVNDRAESASARIAAHGGRAGRAPAAPAIIQFPKLAKINSGDH